MHFIEMRTLVIPVTTMEGFKSIICQVQVHHYNYSGYTVRTERGGGVRSQARVELKNWLIFGEVTITVKNYKNLKKCLETIKTAKY